MGIKLVIKLLNRWLEEKQEAEMQLISAKKTFCVPAHLPPELAKHIVEQASERGWSNSQYLRWLAMLDKKRCDDEEQLMAEASGLDSEQIKLLEQEVQSERGERKEKA